ncbi:hypothetical protein Fmac_014297 [Flemingia macrophylla]|uniref:Glutathione S-transferase n=1 Tax=Flemingia macrophylla TaxID=520843 RepID=A0ABD1MBC3_9FABA
MEEASVVLLDFWPSSYGMRVKIALAEKGITYVCKQEDLQPKSSLLLKMNPIHRMIPVLIHNGKPICESLNIVYNVIKKVWAGNGKEQEEYKKQLIECLKTLENELGDKSYFGGEDFGYVDVALVPFTSWFYTVETFGKLSIEEECPKLVAWAKRCKRKESVAMSLPHPHHIYAFALQYRDMDLSK